MFETVVDSYTCSLNNKEFSLFNMIGCSCKFAGCTKDVLSNIASFIVLFCQSWLHFCMASGMILQRVSMEWTSMSFLSALDTVLPDAAGASPVLESSTEWPRRMRWSGSRSSMRVSSSTRLRLILRNTVTAQPVAWNRSQQSCTSTQVFDLRWYYLPRLEYSN